jgi:hypothetical protein
MPGGDGTGPAGMGPMTGRAAGYCAGYGVPGFMNPMSGGVYAGWGRGYGAWGAGFWGGAGRRGGWRNWYRATGLPGWARVGMGLPAWGGYGFPSAPPAAEQESEILRAQAEYLEGVLADIRKRIEELAAEAPQE